MKKLLLVFLSLTLSLCAQTTKVGGSGKSKVSGTGKTKVSANTSGITVTNAWKNWVNAQSLGITVSVTAGRSISLFFSTAGGTHTNQVVSDNIDGTTGWVKDSGIDNGTTGLEGAFWHKFNMPSGVTTITIASSGGTTYVQAYIHEVTNVTSFTGGETNSSNVASSTNPQTTSVTNATATSIIFSGINCDSAANPESLLLNGTGTVGTYSFFSTNSYDLDGNVVVAGVGYRVLSASASQKLGWTVGTTVNSLLACQILH